MTEDCIMNYARLSQYNSLRDAFVEASRLRDMLSRRYPELAVKAEQIMDGIEPLLHDARNAVIRREASNVVQDEQ